MNIFERILYFFFPQARNQLRTQEYPRTNSIVRLRPNSHQYQYEREQATRSDFFNEWRYVYLGEIVNMPGHCILLGTRTNEMYMGYHCDEFEEIPEEEV